MFTLASRHGSNLAGESFVKLSLQATVTLKSPLHVSLTELCRFTPQSTSSLESNLEGLALVLQADLPNYKPKIIHILCEW